MKLTVEISDSLLRQVRKLAEREGVTLRALVERGLRRARFRGQGLQAEFRQASWHRLRDTAHEGHCGQAAGAPPPVERAKPADDKPQAARS